MKKKYLLLFLVFSLFSIKVISYQPAEQGLLFYDEYEKKLKRLNSGFRIRKAPIVASQRAKVFREKRGDGTDSLVFNVNGLHQFLHLSMISTKPIVVNVFSNNNSLKTECQDLADRLKDRFTFVSIKAQANLPLVQLLLLILRSKGIRIGELKGKFPLFLFCKKDFTIFHNGSVSFRKDGLSLVAKGKVSQGTLLGHLQRLFKLKTGEEEKGSFSQKVKNWFRKKFKSER